MACSKFKNKKKNWKGHWPRGSAPRNFAPLQNKKQKNPRARQSEKVLLRSSAPLGKKINQVKYKNRLLRAPPRSEKFHVAPLRSKFFRFRFVRLLAERLRRAQNKIKKGSQRQTKPFFWVKIMGAKNVILPRSILLTSQASHSQLPTWKLLIFFLFFFLKVFQLCDLQVFFSKLSFAGSHT